MPEQIRFQFNSFTHSSSSLGSCCTGSAAATPWVSWGNPEGVLPEPCELSAVQEQQRRLAALSPSPLDVTNSLPMTSSARYSVPASSERAEDRAGGDRCGEKDFSAKARKYLSQQTGLPVAHHRAGMQLMHRASRQSCDAGTSVPAPQVLRAADKAPTKPPFTLGSEISAPSSKPKPSLLVDSELSLMLQQAGSGARINRRCFGVRLPHRQAERKGQLLFD